jgi:hypothetical protein
VDVGHNNCQRLDRADKQPAVSVPWIAAAVFAALDLVKVVDDLHVGQIARRLKEAGSCVGG